MRRRPKQLDLQPLLFRPSTAGGVPLVSPGGGDPSAGDHRLPAKRAAAGAWVATDEHGELRGIDDRAEAAAWPDDLRQRAHAIARRLSVRARSPDRHERSGSGRLVSVPYRFGSDDIDLDRTLTVLAERPVPDDTDVIVRERVRSRWAVVLVVDVSGSMRGDKALTAAATVGALSGEFAGDELAVVAFWSDAAIVKRLHEPRGATSVLNDLVRLPARGLTNVAFALEVARQQLSTSRARRRRVVLLSDCVHNAGPDPRPQAMKSMRLDILFEVNGEHDEQLATELARLGHGQLTRIRNHHDVAPALNRMLTGF